MHGWLQQGRWQAVQPGSRRRRCRAEQAALHAGWLEREAAAEDERRGGEHFRGNREARSDEERERIHIGRFLHVGVRWSALPASATTRDGEAHSLVS